MSPRNPIFIAVNTVRGWLTKLLRRLSKLQVLPAPRVEVISKKPSEIGSPAIITPVRQAPLDVRLSWRRRIANDPKAYTYLGTLQKIVFDPHGMSLPKLDYPVFCPNMLGWLEEPYPRLALSLDQQDLLVIGKVRQPSDWPHPTETVATALPGWQTRGGVMPRPIPQRYSERTIEFIGKGNGDGPDFSDPDTFFVLQPIEQILVKPHGATIFNFVRPGVGPDATSMAFLINPKTGEGHFIGGRVVFDSRIHSAA